ncbi:MAG: glutamate-1-semialdehyde 2,1-aminomutase [Clostridia bacterium]
MSKSEILFERAKKCMPGGVNSPVRSFGSVGLSPRFIEKADKAYMQDVDLNKYIDYVCSWGPMILGHNNDVIKENVIKAMDNGLSFGAATEIEVEMAEFIVENIPSIEMLRMVNSGTEAVMSAIRVARGFTSRNKIIKFAGCYHGHCDAMLVKAGSGALTEGSPDSAGVPSAVAADTLIATYNNIDSVKELFTANKGEIAALIIEPVAANMGLVTPRDNFLQEIRDLCTENDTLLIFDEVITGFRLGFTGAQGYYGITPDLSTFGKIIGAGMPVGCYGGRKDVMSCVAPLGTVYQAGTLSGNPIAMTAGLTLLKMLKENMHLYKEQAEMGDYFFAEVEKILAKNGLPYTVNHIGSLGSIFFSENKVCDYETAKTSDTKAFANYFKYMLEHNIYIAPSQFEALFLSSAHTKDDIHTTLKVMDDYFSQK